jgi:hypothetical protein
MFRVSTEPILVAIPHDDDEFAATVHRLIDGAPTAEALERRLRTIYPAARVHRRLLVSEPVPTWYAYRDGRWRPSEQAN